MLDNDVRIYNAANFTSPPKSLREVLDFVAVECVYEPKKQQKRNTRLQRLRNKIRKVRRKNRRNSKEKDEPNAALDFDSHSQFGSTAGSTADSTTSSLTMTTLLGGKSTVGGMIDDNPYSKPRVPTINNYKGNRLDNSFQIDLNKMLVFNSSMEENEDDCLLSILDGAEMSLLTPSIDEQKSDIDIDGMTVSTFALIGDTENDLKNARPTIIFTQADDEESTKWWYESGDNKEDDVNLQPWCCTNDAIIMNTNSVLCPAKNHLDAIQKHDLELEVEYFDPSTSNAEKYLNNGVKRQKLGAIDAGTKSRLSERLESKLSEISDFLKLTESEDTIEKNDTSTLPFVTKKRTEDLMEVDTSNTDQDLGLNSGLTKAPQNDELKRMLYAYDRRKQKILDLRNAQLAKYEVVQTILEDGLYDEQIRTNLNALMSKIDGLEEEIKGFNTPQLIQESCDDLFDDLDDSIEEIEKRYRVKR